jgi:hypothetical protein
MKQNRQNNTQPHTRISAAETCCSETDRETKWCFVSSAKRGHLIQIMVNVWNTCFHPRESVGRHLWWPWRWATWSRRTCNKGKDATCVAAALACSCGWSGRSGLFRWSRLLCENMRLKKLRVRVRSDLGNTCRIHRERVFIHQRFCQRNKRDRKVLRPVGRNPVCATDRLSPGVTFPSALQKCQLRQDYWQWSLARLVWQGRHSRLA